MALVGWGEAAGMKYWVLQNSSRLAYTQGLTFEETLRKSLKGLE